MKTQYIVIALVALLLILCLQKKERFYYSPNALIGAAQNVAAVQEAEDISAGLQYGY